MINSFRQFAILAAALTFGFTASAAPRVHHVFIISIDGGKPAVIEDSPMPELETLAREGACTWEASTIFPSTTLPSHTSMLTGTEPDKHHILWNGWVPSNGVVHVPTVFSEARKAGYSTAMFVGKEKFRHLIQPNTVDEFDYNRAASGEIIKADDGEKKLVKEGTVLSRTVADDAAKYIIKEKPGLCFIHLTDADSAGHKFGWGSPEQIQALSNVDKALQVIMNAIHTAKIENDSVVLVSADHGGHNRGHGSKDPQDMHIPWIAWGKGVKRNYSITTPVSTCDTAATALWLLNVPISASIDGRPVTTAFSN